MTIGPHGDVPIKNQSVINRGAEQVRAPTRDQLFNVPHESLRDFPSKCYRLLKMCPPVSVHRSAGGPGQ